MNPRLFDHKQRVIKIVNQFIDQVDGYTANYGVYSETWEFMSEFIEDMNDCIERLVTIYIERGLSK